MEPAKPDHAPVLAYATPEGWENRRRVRGFVAGIIAGYALMAAIGGGAWVLAEIFMGVEGKPLGLTPRAGIYEFWAWWLPLVLGAIVAGALLWASIVLAGLLWPKWETLSLLSFLPPGCWLLLLYWLALVWD